MCGGIGPSKAQMKSERDYQDERDHRTITDAAEIQSDKGRMAGVQRHQRKAQKKVALVQRTMLSGRR